jgi:2-polyprenyl-3-methyl-5-hydroxy-6-metoxy-1,4-benzoquinol methylase
MIRSGLRRCKQWLWRHLGVQALSDQVRSIAVQNDALLRLVESGVSPALAQSIVAQQETISAVSRLISSQAESTARLVEAGSGARHDQLLRFVAEMEDRIRAKVTFETDRVGSLLESQAQSLRSEIMRHIDPIRNLNLDRWKIREYEGLLRYLRRKDYFEAIRAGRLAIPRLETQHPLAMSSNDTRFPWGCKNDNSIALRFNHKLYQFLSDYPRLRVLDLGCAGGGFVRSLLDDGHFAVGLEGSDYPLQNQAGEWSTIPNHLFTCDITKPFQLFDSTTDEPLRFEAITAWEVMEHIAEDDLDPLLENLDRHLAPHGYLLFSIATFLDWDEQTGTIYHVTIKPRDWWENQFARHGFVIENQHPFSKDDWLRGSGQCRGDWHEDAGLGFHIVLRRKAAEHRREDPANVRLASVA